MNLWKVPLDFQVQTIDIVLTYSDYLLKSLFFDKKKSKEKIDPENSENSEKIFIFPVFN